VEIVGYSSFGENMKLLKTLKFSALNPTSSPSAKTLGDILQNQNYENNFNHYNCIFFEFSVFSKKM
jgi:hypothetical protein